MKRTLRLLLAAALAAGGVGAVAPAALADVTCRGTLSNQTIDNNVIVPAGATCTLTNMRISGDVKSYSRSSVTINGGSISGNVQAEASSAVTVRRDAYVDGSVQTKDHGTTQVLGLRINGNIQLEQGNINAVEDNSVGGDVQLFSNRGSQRVFFNTIDGNLQCKSNRLGVSGWGNTVRGSAEDQCRSLQPTFTDVPAGAPFYNDITWLARQRITTGFVDGTFRPTLSVSRGQMAAFLYRAAGSPSYTPPTTSQFRDLTPSSSFFKEISWVAKQGITGGYGDGTFRPTIAIDRDEMAAFLYRSAGSPSYTPPRTSPFRDVRTSHQFYKQITWVNSEGIAGGYADGTFRPDTDVARNIMAAFLYRAR